jgi:hypothetical protein
LIFDVIETYKELACKCPFTWHIDNLDSHPLFMRCKAKWRPSNDLQLILLVIISFVSLLTSWLLILLIYTIKSCLTKWVKMLELHEWKRQWYLENIVWR